MGLHGGQSQAHQVRVAVQVELDRPRRPIGLEAGEIQHEIVEAPYGLPAQRSDHLHGRRIGGLDETREVAGTLIHRPLLCRLEHAGSEAPPLQPRQDAGIKGVGGLAVTTRHADLGHGHALDPHHHPVLLDHEDPGRRIGVGTSEEVTARLEELRTGVGGSALEGYEGLMVFLGRRAQDDVLRYPVQDRVRHRPSSPGGGTRASPATTRHRTAPRKALPEKVRYSRPCHDCGRPRLFWAPGYPAGCSKRSRCEAAPEGSR